MSIAGIILIIVCRFQKVGEEPLSDASALFRMELCSEEVPFSEGRTERSAVFRDGDGVSADVRRE